MSAAVYAGKNNFEAMRLMLSIWKKSKLVRTHVDLHSHSRRLYGYNAISHQYAAQRGMET